MKALAALLLFLPGCLTAGTSASYNPETHEVRFDRPWLGGPVSFSGKIQLPDGTKVEWIWSSDVSLDAAQSVRLEEIKSLNAAISALEQAAARGGVP